MKIAIDIDSTLFHYWDGFARAARTRFGVHLPYEHQVTWGIPELKPEQVRALVTETHRDDNILGAEPYPGAVDAVRRWHGEGHFIQITSHRAETCHAATARWLDAIGLPYDELHCSWDKVARCRELAMDLLIDDSPVNLQRALDEGMIVATIAHPWNRDLREEEEVIAAGDWDGLVDALEPVLAGSPAR